MRGILRPQIQLCYYCRKRDRYTNLIHTRQSISPLRSLSTPYLWASRVRIGRHFRDSRALTVAPSNMHRASSETLLPSWLVTLQGYFTSRDIYQSYEGWWSLTITIWDLWKKKHQVFYPKLYQLRTPNYINYSNNRDSLIRLLVSLKNSNIIFSAHIATTEMEQPSTRGMSV